jgi:hypothetical protein
MLTSDYLTDLEKQLEDIQSIPKGVGWDQPLQGAEASTVIKLWGVL